MADEKQVRGKQVPIPVTILAVVGLVGFMVWWGIRSFGPDPEIVTPEGKVWNDWLKKIAIEATRRIDPELVADIKKINAPKETKLLEAPKTKTENIGEGFTMKEKATPKEIKLAKATQDYKIKLEKYNQTPHGGRVLLVEASRETRAIIHVKLPEFERAEALDQPGGDDEPDEERRTGAQCRAHSDIPQQSQRSEGVLKNGEITEHED